jgi:apolipoprotein N-acyltransferase
LQPRARLKNKLIGPASRYADAVALIAGAMLVLGFAPFNLFPLAILAPALLFVLWREATPRRAAWRGFLFGLGMFGAGISWVYVSMHNFGNMPAPMAAVAALWLAALLALYPALLGGLQARWFDRQPWRHGVLVLPALWTLFEWVRGWFLSGFPWLNLGYSQVGTPLAGFAPWLGVYGVSFVCVLSAGLLVQGLQQREKLWVRYVPLLALLWLGGWLAGKIEWTRPVDGPLQVALVQGNVPLAIKWRPEYRERIVANYLALSEEALAADLIVWPEAAVPAYFDQMGSLVGSLERMAREYDVDFLFGVVERDSDRRQYFNSVASVGHRPGLYRKQHLVPFGEFLPLKPWLSWLLDYLHIPMSDFSAGPPDQPLLTAAGQKIGVSVCYEDAFGEEVIRNLPEATLLVNVSEDAWFGDSLASPQRLQMARLRALESGRPMLRAANTGPSAIIDHRGDVVAQSPQFQAQVLNGEVQPRQGATPYVHLGNWPVVLLCLGIVAAGWVRRRPGG